jgi:hypothetical protein
MASVSVARVATVVGAALRRALLPGMLLASAVISTLLWMAAKRQNASLLNLSPATWPRYTL